MNTLQKKQILKDRSYFLITLIFIYVVLFEFILPVNKILPKPSLLFESIFALVEDYNLIAEMAITTAVIYLSIAAGYFLVYLFSYPLKKISQSNSAVLSNFRLFKNFPAFFFAILFAFWFDDSLFAQLGFAAVASTLFLLIIYLDEQNKVDKAYIDSAKSLSLSEKDLHQKVVWKYTQPKLFGELKRLHYYLWVLILIYEFIVGFNGFGSIYKFALEYRDFSAIIMLAIIISLLIWLGNFIIDYFKNKIVFWKV